MSFAYSVETSKAADVALAAVQESLAAHRFSVLWQHDMAATLEAKGFAGHRAMHVLEVCNAGQADAILRHGAQNAYFLPCRLLVRAVDDGSEIGFVGPQSLVGLAGDAADEFTRQLARDVEGELRAIVDDAAR